MYRELLVLGNFPLLKSNPTFNSKMNKNTLFDDRWHFRKCSTKRRLKAVNTFENSPNLLKLIKNTTISITDICWSLEVFSGTVHWFCSKTSFHPLLWTSSGLKGSWKLSTYIRFGSLRSVKVLNLMVIRSLRSAKSVKPNSNWKPKKLKVLNLIRWKSGRC